MYYYEDDPYYINQQFRPDRALERRVAELERIVRQQGREINRLNRRVDRLERIIGTREVDEA